MHATPRPSPTRLIADDALGLLTRGYDFAQRIWSRVGPGSRSAPLRLLGRDALLVRGAEGVALFYDERRISRAGAMPAVVREPLFGHGSVHALDGDAHRHRKAAFVDALHTEEQVSRLTPFLEREWTTEREAWLRGGTATAYEAAVGAFGRAIMSWAGLPGTPAAKTRWSARLAQIVDGFGVPYSPQYAIALGNRLWSDRHARALIEAARGGTLHPAEGTALHTWATHRSLDGELLPAHTAGVELQNSIRPMIAAARFVAYAAADLHDHPEWAERIAAETAQRRTLVGGPLATRFAQEVRRTGLFVPLLPGVATTDLALDGHSVRRGGRVLIDILGTNTDPSSWTRPEEFDPERFRDVDVYESLPAFIPQGGGDVATGHRCPGEKLVIAGLTAAIAVLSDPEIVVRDEGLEVNRRRLPTMPASGARVRAASGCPVH